MSGLTPNSRAGIARWDLNDGESPNETDSDEITPIRRTPALPLGSSARVRRSQPRLTGKARRVTGSSSPPGGAIDNHSTPFFQDTDTTGHVLVKKQVTIGIKCPCEKNCGALIQISKYGHHNRNKNYKCACPHCGYVPEKGFWSCEADFKNHINGSTTCRSIRDPLFKHTSAKKSMGPRTIHYVNNPLFKVVTDGKEKFKCPVCNSQYKHTDRWDHVLRCFPKHNKDIKA